ncbi:MAG: hypothetical protein KTR25_14925 [Myxococcales bacterium]|nr:hypothetical protein [Myxococcales bacterium]
MSLRSGYGDDAVSHVCEGSCSEGGYRDVLGRVARKGGETTDTLTNAGKSQNAVRSL